VVRCSWLCAPSGHQGGSVIRGKGYGGQKDALTALFAAPSIYGIGVGQFVAFNRVVDGVVGKASVHQFLHGAWFLAKVL
jgi:hypothetical protein